MSDAAVQAREPDGGAAPASSGAHPGGGRPWLWRAADRPAWPAALLALVGVVETLPSLGRPSFWFDEAATLSASRRPLGALWHLCLHQDAVLGAYYVVMHGWIRVFGASEVSVRTPSLLAYAVTIHLTVLLGWRLLGRRAGLVAGCLCLVLPGLTWSALEARPTAMATAAVAASMYVLLTAPPAAALRRAWLSAALLSIGVLLQLTAAFLLPAQHPPSRWRRNLPALALLLPLAPLAVVAHRQQAQVSWLPSSLGGNLAAAAGLQFVTGARSTTVWVTASEVSAAALGVVLLACSTAYVLRVRAVPTIVRWAYLPGLLAVAVGLTGVHLYNERYVVVCAPGLALTVGAACRRRRRRDVVALTVVLAVLGAPSVVAQRAGDGKWGEDLRQTAAFVAATPTDAPVIHLGRDAESVAAAYPSAFTHRRQVPRPDTSWGTGLLWAPVPTAAQVRHLLDEHAGHDVLLLVSTTARDRELAPLHLGTTTCRTVRTQDGRRTSAVLLHC